MTTREKNRYITKECNQTKSNFTFKRPTYSTLNARLAELQQQLQAQQQTHKQKH